MYVLILAALLAGAGSLIYTGLSQGRLSRIYLGSALGVGTLLFFKLLDFWTELLWFETLGFGKRFWTVVIARIIFALVGMVAAFLLLFLLTAALRRTMDSNLLYLWRALGAALGTLWGLRNWEIGLRYWYGVEAGIREPILGRDVTFYLFDLPFYDQLYWLLLYSTCLGLAAGLSQLLKFEFKTGAGSPRLSFDPEPARRELVRPLSILIGCTLLVLSFGKLLNVYHLLFSRWGAVTGPGWTDVHIRLPAYYTCAGLTALPGFYLLLRALGKDRKQSGRGISLLIAAPVSVLVVWGAALTAVPGLLQWLRVEPNEITFELPYIANNIQFTRKAFGLDRAEEREFPALEKLEPEVLDADRSVLSEVRLWDWRALDEVYEQFQEIRLYYEFVDVDVDRYTFGGKYRQVMVSAREMNLENLPAQSQTFVNKRFKYTHGYGITMTPVSQFTSEGLPELTVRDIPPRSDYPELKVEQPRIYYGQRTRTHVFVNTREEEFDYPSGDENKYVRYSGTGGVPLTGFWRKFAFGWRFDGTSFLLSEYPTDESRVLFHRNIRERVHAVAPFLTLDSDPYVVLSEGKLYWILDGYTTSEFFPYSEPYAGQEVIDLQEGAQTRSIRRPVTPGFASANYVRNSVKAVVGAFDGTVHLYVFDSEDPILRVYRNIFPDLFVDREEMPKDLEKHVRYPEDLLLAQGLVYAKYHMSDPKVFYNQEDLWVRATEKYYGRVQPVEPYYIMWQQPGSDESKFILMLPFTPRNRQVLIGWIAGMCDSDDYGRFLAYKFPKEKTVLGPQQVETKIDQDPFLSGQLSLWDQRGSRVIRGNVLAIPIEETLIYVEPIYLQAETAAYPELQLVAVMHGERLSYAQSLEEALEGLFRKGEPSKPAASNLTGGISPLEKAREAFKRYRNLQAQGHFAEAGEQLEIVEDLLEEMTGTSDTPEQ